MLSWLLLNAEDIASGAHPPTISPMHPPTGFSPPSAQHPIPHAQPRPVQQMRDFPQESMPFPSPDPFAQHHLMGYVPIYQTSSMPPMHTQRQISSPASSGSAGMPPPPPVFKAESTVSVGSNDELGSEALDVGDGDGDGSVADGSGPASKRKKLQKNRDSARECRKKQRVRTEELQERVNELKAENEQLHAHVRALLASCALSTLVCRLFSFVGTSCRKCSSGRSVWRSRRSRWRRK